MWGIQKPSWTWLSRFLFPPLALYHKSSTRFSKLVRSLFCNSKLFLALSLWPLNGIFWGTQFHSIYNGSDSFPGFFDTSLVFSIFSLCVKVNTHFIRTFLPLYYSFIPRIVCPSLPVNIFHFLFSQQKSKYLVCSRI